MYELLKELKERLLQIAIVGLKSIPEDFRLKKLQEKLKALSSKAPVLAKLYELVTKLIDGEEVATNYIELNGLVDTILVTQGNSKPKDEEQLMECFEGHKINRLTYRQVAEVKELFRSGTQGKWVNLKRAYDSGKLIDHRLLHYFLRHIGDGYVYRDLSVKNTEDQYFSMVTILKSYGEEIIPILMQCFDKLSINGKVNAIGIISELMHEEYNDYYLKWFEETEEEAIIIALLKALGDSKENEAIVLGFKTRKKKVQEARILALAKIGTQTAIKEVKKYCFKDTELFEKVYAITPFLTENELFDLIRSIAIKVNEENLTPREAYKSKQCKLLLRLLDYIQKYDTDKVIEIYKEIMGLKSEKTGLYFEAIIGRHLISESLLKTQDMERLKFLASIKDSYGGYYLADSFVAALRCYDSAQVYEEFATLTTKKCPQVIINIKHILEQIVDKLNGQVRYNDACATCEKRENCATSTFKPRSVDNNIVLDGNRSIEILLEQIKWDKRWIEYSKKQNLKKIYGFFRLQCIDESNRAEIRAEYIEELEAFKQEVEAEIYPNLANQQRKKAEEQIEYFLNGLFATGATAVVVEHIPYFVFYLNMFEAMFFKHLKEEDLVLLDELGTQLEGLSDYRRKKITDFIEKAKKIVSAKNGKYYGAKTLPDWASH